MSGELSARTRDILTTYSRIAMVGVSGNPTRASYRALVHMKSKGYTVYPVNPSYDEILGLKCYKSLLDIQEPVDIVDIFRRADTVTSLIACSQATTNPDRYRAWKNLILASIPACYTPGKRLAPPPQRVPCRFTRPPRLSLRIRNTPPISLP